VGDTEVCPSTKLVQHKATIDDEGSVWVYKNIAVFTGPKHHADMQVKNGFTPRRTVA
jgi:hypothetical protein